MTDGLYHIHRRHRTKLATYPHPHKWVNLLDRIVLGVAIAGPLFDIPQLIEIYVHKSAQDVSLLTWFFFTFFAIPWLIYGIVHKEKPIIVGYTLWIILDSLIVAGILIY